jgi:predicted nucleic-acid-binding Zn-ribbon protein
MSESEIKKCPKCGGEMVTGVLSVAGLSFEINWRVRALSLGEKIVAHRCKQCGFSELYSTQFQGK